VYVSVLPHTHNHAIPIQAAEAKEKEKEKEVVAPRWMSEAVLVDTDLDSDVVKVDGLGLNAALVALLRANGVTHFFPGTARAPLFSKSHFGLVQLRKSSVCSQTWHDSSTRQELSNELSHVFFRFQMAISERLRTRVRPFQFGRNRCYVAV
jgi:hypothetical protein